MRLEPSSFIAILFAFVCFGATPGRAQEKEPVAQEPAEFLKEATFGNGYSLLPYFQEDALIMHRSQGGFDPGNFIWGTGPRIVLGIPLGEQTAIETGYFSIFSMNASASLAGPQSGGAGGVIVTATNFNTDYHSFASNAELNFRYWLTPEFSLMTGFRYMNWHESLGAAFDATVPIAGNVVPLGTIREQYHTTNNLYGFQLGAEWKGSLTNKLGLVVGGKAGIFGARTQMDAALNIPAIGAADTSAAATRTSFVGEFGVVGTYALTDYLKLRAGYQVMWIEGLALAPQQVETVNFMGASPINNRSGVFLHGAVLGLEYRW